MKGIIVLTLLAIFFGLVIKSSTDKISEAEYTEEICVKNAITVKDVMYLQKCDGSNEEVLSTNVKTFSNVNGSNIIKLARFKEGTGKEWFIIVLCIIAELIISVLLFNK